MATNRFARFNKKKVFEVDRNLFNQDKFLKAKDIYEMDNGQPEPHLLVGIWRHDTSEEDLEMYPTLPEYSYTLGVKIGEDYFYVNAPDYMRKDFDEILKDPNCIFDINAGRAAICAISYEKTRRDKVTKELVTENYYGFEFC